MWNSLTEDVEKVAQGLQIANTGIRTIASKLESYIRTEQNLAPLLLIPSSATKNANNASSPQSLHLQQLLSLIQKTKTTFPASVSLDEIQAVASCCCSKDAKKETEIDDGVHQFGTVLAFYSVLLQQLSQVFEEQKELLQMWYASLKLNKPLLMVRSSADLPPTPAGMTATNRNKSLEKNVMANVNSSTTFSEGRMTGQKDASSATALSSGLVVTAGATNVVRGLMKEEKVQQVLPTEPEGKRGGEKKERKKSHHHHHHRKKEDTEEIDQNTEEKEDATGKTEAAVVRHQKDPTMEITKHEQTREESTSRLMSKVTDGEQMGIHFLPIAHTLEDALGSLVLSSRDEGKAYSDFEAFTVLQHPKVEYNIHVPFSANNRQATKKDAITMFSTLFSTCFDQGGLQENVVSNLFFGGGKEKLALDLRPHQSLEQLTTTTKKDNAEIGAHISSSGWRWCHLPSEVKQEGIFNTFYAFLELSTSSSLESVLALWIHDVIETASCKTECVQLLQVSIAPTDGNRHHHQSSNRRSGLNLTAVSPTSTLSLSNITVKASWLHTFAPGNFATAAGKRRLVSAADSKASTYLESWKEGFSALFPPVDPRSAEEVEDETPGIEVDGPSPDRNRDGAPQEEEEEEGGKKGIVGKSFAVGKSIALSPFTAGKFVLGKAAGAVRGGQENVFRNNFPELKDESIEDISNCALMDGKVLRQGYMFLTKKHVAFASTVLSGKFTIAYEEVKKLRKKKTAVVFDNAIEIETLSGETYFMTSFLQRDEVFRMMHSLWTGE